MSQFLSLTRRAVAVLCFALVVCVAPAGAVVGGQEDTSNAYANVGNWQLRIGGEWFGFCTGTLVAEDVVLTAAHCVDFSVCQVVCRSELFGSRSTPPRTPAPRTTPSTTSSFIPTGPTVRFSWATRSTSAWRPRRKTLPWSGSRQT